MPIAGAQVILGERALTAATDAAGRYLFRDLPAGSFTISAPNEAQTSPRTVRLGGQPVDVVNIDFQTARPVPADSPDPAAIPSQPPAQLPRPMAGVAQAKPATAQQHNIRGRQLSKEGRYREAIVELTEAIRLAPALALAFNARGYALFMLHDCAAAIKDLDQAIQLNPSYGNAYRIRSVARRTIGDTVGAAADFERSGLMVH